MSWLETYQKSVQLATGGDPDVDICYDVGTDEAAPSLSQVTVKTR